MAQKLRVRQLKRGSAQLAHVVNRMFTTLETKGILRSAPEEFMLSSMYKAHDELAAEFLRTCRHEQFLGCKFLELYDGMASEEGLRETIFHYRNTHGGRPKPIRSPSMDIDRNIRILGSYHRGSFVNGSKLSS